VTKTAAPVESTLYQWRCQCNVEKTWRSSEEMLEEPVKPTVQKKAWRRQGNQVTHVLVSEEFPSKVFITG
jgi:hypothetical protein